LIEHPSQPANRASPIAHCIIGKEYYLCRNASHALICTLRALHKIGGDRLLDELAEKIRGPRRNHLARTKAEVYPFENSWDNQVRDLVPGRFIGLNCNNDAKEKWVEAACSLLGKSYGPGRDVWVIWAKPLPPGKTRAYFDPVYWEPGP